MPIKVIVPNVSTKAIAVTNREDKSILVSNQTQLGQPFDMMLFYPGHPSDNEKLVSVVVGRDIEFFDQFAQSVGHVGIAPSTSYALDIKINNTSVGAIHIASDSTFTFSNTANVVINKGDVFTLVGQATTDPTVYDISVTFVGTKR